MTSFFKQLLISFLMGRNMRFCFAVSSQELKLMLSWRQRTETSLARQPLQPSCLLCESIWKMPCFFCNISTSKSFLVWNLDIFRELSLPRWSRPVARRSPRALAATRSPPLSRRLSRSAIRCWCGRPMRWVAWAVALQRTRRSWGANPCCWEGPGVKRLARPKQAWCPCKGVLL